MNSYVLFVLVGLVACICLGGVLGRVWERREQRDVEKKWQERERLLDRRRPEAGRREILRRRRRPAYRGRRGGAPARGDRRSRGRERG